MPIVPKKAFANVSNLVAADKNIKNARATKRLLDSEAGETQITNKKLVKNHRSYGDENAVDESVTMGLENKIKKITISESKSTTTIVVAKKSVIVKEEELQQEKPKSATDKDYWKNYYVPPPNLPENVVDYDKTQLDYLDSEPVYSYEIFSYFKQKELDFKVTKYMHEQTELSDKMRTVLVDWLVELQQLFALNHETLYTAVKMLDHYLMKVQLPRARLQLLGLTAFFIACKFDVSIHCIVVHLKLIVSFLQERLCPIIDDFIYVSDDAYTRQEIIEMEMDILRTLQFNINYPLSYTFLRRYARCGSVSNENLTLARYILESSLLDYSFVEELDSKMAAASLLLALKLKNLTWVRSVLGFDYFNYWNWLLYQNETFEFYSEYKEEDLIPLMKRMNQLIATPTKYTNIKNKYLDQ